MQIPPGARARTASRNPAAGNSHAAAALTTAGEVFTTWESLLADSLSQHGAEPEHAEQLATLAVAAAEGAVAMCRAQHSIRPLDRVATQLEAMIATALRSPHETTSG